MYGVDWAAEAQVEVLDALAWYMARDEAVAGAFDEAVQVAVRQVADSPERYPSYLHGSRRYVMSGFPYSVIYRVRGDAVHILAIHHARRREGYWRGRKV